MLRGGQWCILKRNINILYTTMAIVSFGDLNLQGKEYNNKCNSKTLYAYQFTNEGYPQER